MNQKKKDLMSKATDLRSYEGDDSVIPWAEMEAIIDDQPKGKNFKSKIPTLDKSIEGFEGGELIVISGPTKSGKTLLGQTMTVNFFEQDIRTLWFSYELTPRQFGRAFNGNPPVFVLPKKLKAYALEWIEDRIAEALAKYRIGVVFIDHLHFLFDLARSRNQSIEIGQVIRFLKSIAIEGNLVIFLLCHLNRFDISKEPTHDNFRDSSFIAQESDTGMLIWRVKDTENKAWLKVCYSRRTGTWERKIPLIKNPNGLLRETTDVD